MRLRKSVEKMPMTAAHLQNHVRPPRQERGTRGAQRLSAVNYAGMMGSG